MVSIEASVSLLFGDDGDGSEDEDEEEEERQDQMSRVAVTLVALAETALGGGRFPTTSLSEDVKRLKQLGPEQPGERERAGAGGWRLRGGGGGKADGAIADGYKPSWRDEERRAMHRARMALVVRIREKRALQALGAWARHPCRSEEELLPPLRMSCAGTTKKGKKSGGGLDGLVCGAC